MENNNPVQQTSQIPDTTSPNISIKNTQPSLKHSKRVKRVALGVAIVILLLLGFVMYFLANLVVTTTKVTTHNNPQIGKKYILISNIPKGWKSYTNYKYMYQISTPQDWHITGYSDQITNLLCLENPQDVDSINISKQKPTECRDSNNQKIDMSFGHGGGRVDNLEAMYSFAHIKPIKVFTLAGEKAVEYINGSSFEIVMNHADTSYSFTIPTNGSKTYNTVYDNVMSTLTFLTPEQLQALPKPTPTPINFRKRYYKITDKIIDFRDYPSEIKDLPDDQLVGINCSETVGGPFRKIDQKALQSNPTITKIMKLESTQPDYQLITAINICQLEDGRTLAAIYKYRQQNNNNYKASVEFGLFKNDKMDNSVTFDPGDEAGQPAIGFIPLEYTKNNVFYYTRDVGDAVSEVDLHKIDFNNNTQKVMFTCRDDYIEVNNKRVNQPSCK